MLVAIDAGNTNVVFAIFEGETLRARWRASSDAKRTADEYAVWLTQLMALQGLKPADITGAIIANVVPAAAYTLATLCTEFFKVAPKVIGDPDVDIGIAVRIARKSVGEGKGGPVRVDIGGCSTI